MGGYDTRAGRQAGRADRSTVSRDVRTDRPVDRSEGRSDRQGERGDRRDDRQENRDERWDDRQDMRDDRQDFREDAREDRQDFLEDIHDDHHDRYDYDDYWEDRWRFAVGASITAAAFRSLTCATSSVVVNGVTYYNCGPTWYRRGYGGGSVTYVVVNAPPGY
jgi:hypothetical protein